MSSLEAKIVVLGSQGVGKTSLVTRYCKGAFNPAQTTSTVGASFMTKRVVDADTDTVVRLQIWDTAGQERFRSISRLYYRGANACILCYSITDAQSFAEMGIWLTELRRNLPPDIVLHVVGTKADIVARDSTKREVPFERCIAYVAENLAPGRGSTPPPTATPGLTPLGGTGPPLGAAAAMTSSGSGGGMLPLSAATTISNSNNNNSNTYYNYMYNANANAGPEPRSPSSKRSSGFWGQEVGWDACHEISAESGEGVEEVFRVVARKLVEQNRKMQQAILAATATPGGGGGTTTPGLYSGYDSSSGGGGYHQQQHHGAGAFDGSGGGGYFDGGNPRGSFRVGRDRRSWLFSPVINVENPANGGAGYLNQQQQQQPGEADERGRRRKGCC
ncbi:rab type ras GTPase [Xylariomycetidae sp. FL2044]|nr:rab type ras GTPase [Xylariomycetidae sp. FL2044]